MTLSLVSHNVRRAIVGTYRLAIMAVLFVLSLPVFWLVDYKKMQEFVIKDGDLYAVLLGFLIGAVLLFFAHPVKAEAVVLFTVLMPVVIHPEQSF